MSNSVRSRSTQCFLSRCRYSTICTRPIHTYTVFQPIPNPPNKSMHIYHPFLVNSVTRFVTSWKPFRNLALHRSDANRFRFSPPLSWNFCLLKSLLTLFLAIRLPSIPMPLTISRPRLTSKSMVRPYEGFKRGYWANVSSCCTASGDASEGLLARVGFIIPSDVAIWSKFRPGLLTGRLLPEPANSSPKTRPVGEVDLVFRGMLPKRELIVCVASLWVVGCGRGCGAAASRSGM